MGVDGSIVIHSVNFSRVLVLRYGGGGGDNSKGIKSVNFFEDVWC